MGCPENCQHFAMQDIISYCRNFFEIGPDVSDLTMRERIKKEIGAEKWAAAKRPLGERKFGYFFTQDELQKYVFETSLYGYFLERASDRARIALTEGKPFLEWWNGLNIGAEGYQALASQLVDLAFELCMQVHGERLVPPIIERVYTDEEKVEAIFEQIKTALMFYPQFADMFGGESEQAKQEENERLAERVSELVAERIAPMLAKPTAEAEPRPQNKHGTFKG